MPSSIRAAGTSPPPASEPNLELAPAQVGEVEAELVEGRGGGPEPPGSVRVLRDDQQTAELHEDPQHHQRLAELQVHPLLLTEPAGGQPYWALSLGRPREAARHETSSKLEECHLTCANFATTPVFGVLETPKAGFLTMIRAHRPEYGQV